MPYYPHKSVYLILALSTVIICSAFLSEINTKIDAISRERASLAAYQEASNIPKGYKLLYTQPFEKKGALSDFGFSAPETWSLHEENGNKALVLSGKVTYKPEVRSPHHVSLIRSWLFGDFILEARLRQTGGEYNHRDMCVFFGFQDPKNFYYVHLATKADPNAHNVFLVQNDPRKNIAKQTTEGVDWGETTSWHRVRIERNVQKGSIKVFFNDMTTPVMEAEDTTFGAGYIGFGSFDDPGMVDDIKIWGPSRQKPDKPFFW